MLNGNHDLNFQKSQASPGEQLMCVLGTCNDAVPSLTRASIA